MADIKKNYYGNESIETIDTERDQVRQKPTIYFGTNDVKGCAHGTFELVTNSLDEIREGHGNFIKVVVDDNNVITVIDNARGVPMGYNTAKETFNWYLVYCKLFASGKYNASNYGASAGLNGVGASITQFASTFMKVVSSRKELVIENGKEKLVGKRYTMNFKDGHPDGELIVEDYDGPTGTAVTYQPDRKVFLSIDIPVEIFLDRFRRMAMLIPNATIMLDYKGTPFTLSYPSGCAGYIEDACQDKVINDIIEISGECEGADDDFEDSEVYKAGFSVAFTFSRDVNFKEVYHNGTYLEEAGTSFDGFRYGLTKVIEEYARKSGKIAHNGRIQFTDIDEMLVAIISTDCPGNLSYFKGQYKTAIGNPLLRKLASSVTLEELRKWAATHKDEMDKIVEAVLLNKEAREKADSVKRKVIDKMKKDINSLGGKPAKFMKCKSTDASKTELYITEGDSAKGAVVLARDAEYQAIMPLRGKILNCLKESLERIMDSDIILDLIHVIGCGVEPRSKYIKDIPVFDINKLNFGKIIICTDADIDGGHIRCLLLTMIYRLMPTLLKRGHVYIAETPLFTITCDKQKYFAYNEEEKVKILGELGQQGYRDSQIKLERSKGLGENDADDMAVSTMNPATRRLVQVEYPEGDDSQFVELINTLMGTDLESRKNIIADHFDSVDVDID